MANNKQEIIDQENILKSLLKEISELKENREREDEIEKLMELSSHIVSIGSKIDVVLDVDIKTNGQHYWLIVPHSERDKIHAIRAEIGLGKPYFGLHMSIGYINERNKIASEYVIKYMDK
jgi:hypothetical protein